MGVPLRVEPARLIFGVRRANAIPLKRHKLVWKTQITLWENALTRHVVLEQSHCSLGPETRAFAIAADLWRLI